MSDWPQPDTEKDATFFRCLDVVERFEGGYADDPNDPGGATKWGIIQKTYDTFRTANGLPLQPVLQMSDEECTTIYYHLWTDNHCGDLPYPFVLCHFDTIVNMAPYWWRQCYAASGGQWGAYLDKRAECYRMIVARRSKSAKFLGGWLDRVAKLRKVATT